MRPLEMDAITALGSGSGRLSPAPSKSTHGPVKSWTSTSGFRLSVDTDTNEESTDLRSIHPNLEGKHENEFRCDSFFDDGRAFHDIRCFWPIQRRRCRHQERYRGPEGGPAGDPEGRAGEALNFPWEVLQAPLYRMETGSWSPWLHCLRASFGDGLLVLMILVLGARVLERLDWFDRPQGRGYAWMSASGVVFAAALEWTAMHVRKRWSYEPTMPLLPGLEIGLVPIAQMLVLPPAIFFVASRLRRSVLSPTS